MFVQAWGILFFKPVRNAGDGARVRGSPGHSGCPIQAKLEWGFVFHHSESANYPTLPKTGVGWATRQHGLGLRLSRRI